jgi:uncharacterized membrane protein YcfT
MTAMLLSAAYVNVSFFAAISRCCEVVNRLANWTSQPAAYIVASIPYKTQGQFWVLFVVAEFTFYTLVFWGVMKLCAGIHYKRQMDE